MSRQVQKDTAKLQQLIRQTPEQVTDLLRGAAQEMVNEIVLGFSDQSPAPAGGPPGVDTGELRASIGWTPDGAGRVLIHDGVEYGKYLELGTEKMPARPFVGPVFERWRMGEFARFARDFGVFE